MQRTLSKTDLLNLTQVEKNIRIGVFSAYTLEEAIEKFYDENGDFDPIHSELKAHSAKTFNDLVDSIHGDDTEDLTEEVLKPVNPESRLIKTLIMDGKIDNIKHYETVLNENEIAYIKDEINKEYGVTNNPNADRSKAPKEN